MSDPKRLFGLPMEIETDRTEYPADDGDVYVWQETIVWVDTGGEVWEKHVYGAWRKQEGDGYSEVIEGYNVPREVLEARGQQFGPQGGTLADTCPGGGPESDDDDDDDDFWVADPEVHLADEPEEDPEPEPEINRDEYEPEEIEPEDWSDVDDV